jgi:DNA adenine methylase
MSTSQIIKPFLKWVGGKTQILEEVLHEFPTQMKNYHEPFLGGGSVLLGLLTCKANGAITVSGNIYASDFNSNLIALYKHIQKSPNELIKEVKVFTDEFSTCKGTSVNRKPMTKEEANTSPESYYFWIRSQFNKNEKQTVQSSAMMLFMNKTCFRGVYREGPNGFNVPFGNYKNPTIVDEVHIRRVSELIQNVIFTCAPFTESLINVVEGDFVYLDPPYAPEKASSFVSYTADGFTIEMHTMLFEQIHTMNKNGIRFLMSNSDVEMVQNEFAEYTVKTISCRRAIHSKQPDTKTNEVLITNM